MGKGRFTAAVLVAALALVALALSGCDTVRSVKLPEFRSPETPPLAVVAQSPDRGGEVYWVVENAKGRDAVGVVVNARELGADGRLLNDLNSHEDSQALPAGRLSVVLVPATRGRQGDAAGLRVASPSVGDASREAPAGMFTVTLEEPEAGGTLAGSTYNLDGTAAKADVAEGYPAVAVREDGTVAYVLPFATSAMGVTTWAVPEGTSVKGLKVLVPVRAKYGPKAK